MLRRLLAPCLVLAGLLAPIPASLAQVPGAKFVRDVPYAEGAAKPKAGVADLYLPAGKTNVGVVVYVYDRSLNPSAAGSVHVADYFVKRGLAVMTVGYAAEPVVRHPRAAEDLATAVAWLNAQASSRGIDATRLWLMGHSNGAHLVSLLALDPRYLAAHKLSTGTIKGVIAVGGTYDVAEVPKPKQGPDVIRQIFGDDLMARRDASPAYYAAAPRQTPVPPFLLAFARNELFGVDEQAKAFYTLLLKAELPVKLVEVSDRTHETIINGLDRRLDDVADLLAPALDRFMAAVEAGTFQKVKDFSSSRGGAPALKAPEMKETRDVLYYQSEKSPAIMNALDIYVPAGKSNVPVVFYVHGGGWRAGDKGKPQTVIDMFGRMGVAVVSPNYRLSPAVKHPTHIEDVARAFAWLYKHAAEYGIDKERIFVSGTSAGGHLTALLALDQKYLRHEGIPDGAIKGVMATSGIYDFPNKPEPGKIPTRREQAFGLGLDEITEASPITYARKDAPPFLLTYTDHDIIMEKEQAHWLYDALRKVGAPARLVVLPDRTHFDQMDGIGIQIALWDDVLGPAMVQFLLDQGVGR